MKLLPVLGQFRHSFPNFQAASGSHPCHSQHREFLYRANEAALLPTLEKGDRARTRTTNASPRRETLLHIHSAPSVEGDAGEMTPLRIAYRTTYCGIPV